MTDQKGREIPFPKEEIEGNSTCRICRMRRKKGIISGFFGLSQVFLRWWFNSLKIQQNVIIAIVSRIHPPIQLPTR